MGLEWILGMVKPTDADLLLALGASNGFITISDASNGKITINIPANVQQIILIHKLIIMI